MGLRECESLREEAVQIPSSESMLDKNQVGLDVKNPGKNFL